WMHNRLRMVVASFLVKDLHIDWRWGERYFLSQLIDGDFASNNGGWQWCASTGADAQPYFRIMNPHLQSKRFDPKGRFIRAWVKELSPLPEHALHEPHSWAAKQNMTLNYFKPVVDHNLASKRAVELFKQAKAKEKQLLLKSEA
ncbi:MAG: FAD-binding domain-containing protein, partial [Enterovibrio sp.]